MSVTLGSTWGVAAYTGTESSVLRFSQEWELFLKIRKLFSFFTIAERVLTRQALCHGPAVVLFSCLRQGHKQAVLGVQMSVETPVFCRKGVVSARIRCSRGGPEGGWWVPRPSV